MPRSPKDNQEIRDARREELLDAATRVFADKGLARTKISDIAAAAGMSHGLVYHYFDSKDAIFGAIVDRKIAQIDDDLQVAGPRAIDKLVASIERARTRACASHKVDAGRLVAQAMMQGSVPEEIRNRLLHHLVKVRDALVEWVAEAQREGDVDDSLPAEELASALICVVRGMSIRMPGMPDLPFQAPQTQTMLRLLRPTAPCGGEDEARGGATRRAARGTHVARARRTR